MFRSTAIIVAVTFLVLSGVGVHAQTPASQQLSREQVLEAHLKDEKSGAAEQGRGVFENLCAGCYRFAATGTDVAPI